MRVEVRNNNVDKALKILKKKLQQDGFFNDLREREFHMTKKVGDQKLLPFVENLKQNKNNLKNLDFN